MCFVGSGKIPETAACAFSSASHKCGCDMTRGASCRQFVTRSNPEPRQGLGSQNPSFRGLTLASANTSDGGENTSVVTPLIVWNEEYTFNSAFSESIV